MSEEQVGRSQDHGARGGEKRQQVLWVGEGEGEGATVREDKATVAVAAVVVVAMNLKEATTESPTRDASARSDAISVVDLAFSTLLAFTARKCRNAGSPSEVHDLFLQPMYGFGKFSLT